jgi:hypothetical protein
MTGHEKAERDPQKQQRDKLSEAAVDKALPEARGLILPDVAELESEGATHAFAVPEPPPSMLRDDATDDSDQDEQRPD